MSLTVHMKDRYIDNGAMAVWIGEPELGGCSNVQLSVSTTATKARKIAIRKLKSFIKKLEEMDQ